MLRYVFTTDDPFLALAAQLSSEAWAIPDRWEEGRWGKGKAGLVDGGLTSD